MKRSGLHLLSEKSYLRASSDGLETCTSVDTYCQGYLEIKCLYSIDKVVTIEMSPMEMAEKFGDEEGRRWGITFTKAKPLLCSSTRRTGRHQQGMVRFCGVQQWCASNQYFSKCFNLCSASTLQMN